MAIQAFIYRTLSYNLFDNVYGKGKDVDKRVEKTQAALKNALLEALKRKRLADITVSELCSTADVSRSTFYSNYPNVFDVFIALVVDFSYETKSLKSHLRCKECEESEGKLPYCIAVRKTTRYKDVVRQDCFLPLLLKVLENTNNQIINMDSYCELGLPPKIANNIMRFQMAGYHATALHETDDEIWCETQRCIDTFIVGGLNALRSNNHTQKEV